jgi:hypothetical protein
MVFILFLFDHFISNVNKMVYKIVFLIDLEYMQSIRQFVDNETE